MELSISLVLPSFAATRITISSLGEKLSGISKVLARADEA
jgi:hypothetical protein